MCAGGARGGVGGGSRPAQGRGQDDKGMVTKGGLSLGRSGKDSKGHGFQGATTTQPDSKAVVYFALLCDFLFALGSAATIALERPPRTTLTMSLSAMSTCAVVKRKSTKSWCVRVWPGRAILLLRLYGAVAAVPFVLALLCRPPRLLCERPRAVWIRRQGAPQRRCRSVHREM